MKNKGFTLIELLAVIVILAIIALITAPIITNTIEESRKSSALRSVELYVDAIDQTLTTKNLNGDFYIDDGWYNINEEGNICLNDECSDTIEVKAKNKPTGGKVYIERKKVSNIEEVKIDRLTINKDTNGKYVIVDKTNEPKETKIGNCIVDGELKKGAQVTCNGDTFHVLEFDKNTVTLFSDKNITADLSNPEQTTEGRAIAFSEEVYWMNGCTYESYYVQCESLKPKYSNSYIYDENSNLYPYVEAYKEKLINVGINVNSARIPVLTDYDNIEHIPIDITKEDDYINMTSDIPAEDIDNIVAQINSMSEDEFKNQVNQNEIIRNYPLFFTFPVIEQAKILYLLTNNSNFSDPQNAEYIIASLYTYPSWVNGDVYWLGISSQSNSINGCVESFNKVDIYDGQVSGVIPYNDTTWSIGIRPVIVINR